MLQRILKTWILVLVALAALAVTACSAVPAPIQQALATATAASTDTPTLAPTALPASEPTATAPAAQTPSQPRTTQPAGANIALALLRRLGLLGGVVAANNGNSLSLRLAQTTNRLQIAPTTLLVVPGIKTAQTSDIRVGDRVVVDLPNGDPNSAPSLVLDFPKGYTADNVVAGLVQLNARGTVTLRTRGGQQIITPSASTAIVSMLGDQPAMGTVKDMARGDAAIVIGQKNGDQFNPQVIVVLDRAALQGNRKQNQPTPTPTP